MVEEGHLLLVLHKPPGPNDVHREGVLFWRKPDGEWQWNQGGSGASALRKHVQSYAELEAQLSKDYQKASSIGMLFDLVEALSPLTLAARNMHLALQTARENIKRDPFIVEVRDLAYEVDRNFELLLEDVRNAIQSRTAREAEEQARLGKEALQASHRLNILAALFFPLTAIASVFGMNLHHGIDEKSTLSFWVIFVFGIVLGFAMKSWVLGKKEKESAARKP